MANWFTALFSKSTYGGGRGVPSNLSFIRGLDVPSEYRGARGKRGELYENSAVTACLGVVENHVSEPPLCVFRDNDEGEREKVEGTLVERLLRDGSDISTGSQLIQSTAVDLLVGGNSYWRFRNDGGGIYLEWIPSGRICPKPVDYYSGDEKLSHYEYSTSTGVYNLEPDEVIHFKQGGLDPNNRLIGRSRFKSALMEVMSDDEATVYTHSVLKNFGVPGLMVGLDDASMTEEQIKDLKRKVWQATTGTRRGEPFVSRTGMELKEVGPSPDKMAIDVLRRIPEERICAVLGVPPMLAGLSLATNAKYSNFKEAREFFVEQTMVPLWKRMAETIHQTFKVLDRSMPEGAYTAFDLTSVAALQEDKNAAWKRAQDGYRAGVLTRAQALRHLGMDASDAEEYTIHEAMAKSRALVGAGEGIKALADVQRKG